MPTGIRTGAKFDNRGKEALEELLDLGHQGPIFIGSAMTNRNSWRVGHWCDVYHGRQYQMVRNILGCQDERNCLILLLADSSSIPEGDNSQFMYDGSICATSVKCRPRWRPKATI